MGCVNSPQQSVEGTDGNFLTYQDEIKLMLDDGVGVIPVTMDAGNAPICAAAVKRLADNAATGKFTRAEPLLLQASMDEAAWSKFLEGEGKRPPARGSVCWVVDTPDIMISLAANGEHDGMRRKVVVFGQVDSKVVAELIEPILRRPVRNATSQKDNRSVKMLENPISFTVGH